jgi:hypothetical protein
MPILRRRHEHPEGRRLVLSGETFDPDDLERGEIELEAVEPTPEPPADEQAEPWARIKEVIGAAAERLREYREANHDDA